MTRRSILLLCVMVLASLAIFASGMPRDVAESNDSIFESFTPRHSPVIDDEVLLQAAGVSDAPSATSKVFIHQHGVDLVQKIVNAVLVEEIQAAVIPDETIKIAGGHVDISNVKISGVAFNAHQIGLLAPNQISIVYTDIQGEVDLDWKYKGPLGIHSHGGGKCNFASTSINALFTFSSDSTGRPLISVTSLSVGMDDLNIHLTGGGAWLINFLIKLFKGTLRKTIASKVTDAATNAFVTLFTNLQQKYPLALPMTGKLLEGTQFNTAMVPTGANGDAPFSINGEYLVASGEYSFQSIGNPIDPRPHDWISDSLPTNPSGTAPMFGLAFDEYFSGSLLYSLTQNKKFDSYIDWTNLKPDAPVEFTTNFLEPFYPNLYAKYPNHNISFTISSYNSQPPLATTSPAGTFWEDSMSLMINVIDESQPQPIVPVCQVLVNYTVTTNFNLLSNSTGLSQGVEFFTGSVTPVVLNAGVIWSGVDPGTFVEVVQAAVLSLANDVIVPIVNEELAQGIPIPLKFDTIELSNVFLSYGNHVLAFGFDAGLVPTMGYLDAAAELFGYQRR